MSLYEHKQRSPLHLILLTMAALFVGFALGGADVLAARIGLNAAACLVAFLALCFAHLTVRDDDGFLTLRYGPLPLFGWRITWSEIESAAVGRTSWIDGWGIHWVPGRGTTFNLWGFDCVVLQVNGKVIRIGTDDPENLAAFISTRIREVSRVRQEDTQQAAM